jgi:hypothetical protein
MAKWKYQNQEKKDRFSDYKTNRLYLKEGEATKMVISDWEFIKSGGNLPSFKCFVVEENGETVDKHWSIWDYDLKEALKVKLRGKNPRSDKVEITVVMTKKGMEDIFELK